MTVLSACFEDSVISDADKESRLESWCGVSKTFNPSNYIMVVL